MQINNFMSCEMVEKHTKKNTDSKLKYQMINKSNNALSTIKPVNCCPDLSNMCVTKQLAQRATEPTETKKCISQINFSFHITVILDPIK